MEIDPLPEDIRHYLRQHFQDVSDEPRQGDYYVFLMKLNSGDLRTLKVHRDLFIFSSLVPDYLRNHNLASQLQHEDVEIARPLGTDMARRAPAS